MIKIVVKPHQSNDALQNLRDITQLVLHFEESHQLLWSIRVIVAIWYTLVSGYDSRVQVGPERLCTDIDNHQHKMSIWLYFPSWLWEEIIWNSVRSLRMIFHTELKFYEQLRYTWATALHMAKQTLTPWSTQTLRHEVPKQLRDPNASSLVNYNVTWWLLMSQDYELGQ